MASTSMSSHADGMHIDTDGKECSLSELGDQHTRLRNEHIPDSPHAISPNLADEHILEPKHKIFLSHSGAQKNFVEHLCKALKSDSRYPFFDERSLKEEKERYERLRKEEKERYERLLKEKEKHELVNQIMRKKNEGLRKTLHAKSRK